MPLISVQRIPPGGWRYQQTETKFNIQNVFSPFSDAVHELVAHRKANNLPRATVADAAKDLDDTTCLRLGNDPSWCDSGAQKKTSPIIPHRAATQSAARVVGAAAKVAGGNRKIVVEQFNQPSS